MRHTIKSGRKSPDGYRLDKLFKRMQTRLPGKTVSSVLLEVCDRKADAALLLEQILSWWECGDDFVCNWTLYRGKADREKLKYMFMTGNDIMDMWGGGKVPRRQLDTLKSLNFLEIYPGRQRDQGGRYIRIRFRDLYTKCFEVVEDLLDKHQPDKAYKSLLTRARMHAAIPFDLYTYRDLINMTYQRAYEEHQDEFLALLNRFNHAEIDGREFRKELAKLDHTVGEHLEQNFEPETIEWMPPKFTSKQAHASHRIDHITSMFSRVEGEMTSARWQLGMQDKPKILKRIADGELDLLVLQFVGVMLSLSSRTRKGLNKKDLMEVCNDMTTSMLFCYESMTQQVDYDRDKFHPNQLIFNELFTIGWLESRVKFKHAIRGEELLNKLIVENRNYGEATSLQRLCIFGKLFPDDTQLIRKYIHKTSDALKGLSVLNTYKQLTEKNRKLLRAMYPLVFNLIETEAQCLRQRTPKSN